jgi:HAE1 family hydrophobic/amphiphilic exporter-1
MAVVVIGGVLLSTVLTLIVVPCAYSLMSRFESTKHQKELREALSELGELPPSREGEPSSHSHGHPKHQPVAEPATV